MKKLLFFAAFIAMMFTAKSQSTNYKAFKVDVMFGYATPSGSSGGVKAGATFTIEPHYRITNDIALGLRLEGAALGYEIKNSDGSSDAKVSLLNSYCATGEYYFMKGSFRPFAGGGLGFFTQSSINTNSVTAYKIPGATKFGFFPTVGFETGHFRVSSSYNLLPDKAGYLAFKLGFFFGGGKKTPDTNSQK